MLALLWSLMVLSAGWVGFAYVGYPILLLAIARLSPRPVRAGEGHAPPISIIIAVHNGEKELPGKLDNTLACDYPGEFEIIVASDNSTDRTDEIAHAGFGIRTYVGRRFLFRTEYNSYVVFTSRDENEEVDEWKVGFSFFF